MGSDISKENGYRRIPQKMAAVEIRDKFEFTIKISNTFRGKLWKTEKLELIKTIDVNIRVKQRGAE